MYRRLTRAPALGIIRLYQVTLSGLFPGTCRFLPTCSQYTYEAVARHGVMKGIWLGLRRLARCRPRGGSGYDPVPE
jgi:putative membrane protein insertion efficiency factor